ncbi:hypothetical protein [Rhodococcus sp. T7]|nr:hypothetical protein [Rhodococcus sp. T7]
MRQAPLASEQSRDISTSLLGMSTEEIDSAATGDRGYPLGPTR